MGGRSADRHGFFASSVADVIVVERNFPVLERAIQSLPDHYREVVLLRDFKEFTIDEIAGQLALTREAAKARLHRARGLIREYLAE